MDGKYVIQAKYGDVWMTIRQAGDHATEAQAKIFLASMPNAGGPYRVTRAYLTEVCAHCGNRVRAAQSPAPSDHAGWSRVAREHGNVCDWADARGRV